MQQQAKVRVNTNGEPRGMWLVNDGIEQEMNLEKFGRGVDVKFTQRAMWRWKVS